jgi:hypothetical protein
MRKSLLVVALVLFSATTFAQNGRVSLGLELAIPGGDYGDNAGTGFGGSLRYEHPVGDNIGLMGTVGYLTYGKKELDFGYGVKAEYTNSMIPIMVGGKYYFTDQQDGFYINLQLGLTMLTTKYEIPDYTVFGVTIPGSSETNSESAFTWSPGVGYALENLDFSVNYFAFSYEASSTINGIEYTTDYSGSWIGLRAAYVFGER